MLFNVVDKKTRTTLLQDRQTQTELEMAPSRTYSTFNSNTMSTKYQEVKTEAMKKYRDNDILIF